MSGAFSLSINAVDGGGGAGETMARRQTAKTQVVLFQCVWFRCRRQCRHLFQVDSTRFILSLQAECFPWSHVCHNLIRRARHAFHIVQRVERTFADRTMRKTYRFYFFYNEKHQFCHDRTIHYHLSGAYVR